MIYPYLVCRNKHFYFRIWIPEDLRPFFKRSEIKKSLKTTNCIRAKNLVKALVYHTERIFTPIRSGMLTPQQIRELASEYINLNLHRREEVRNFGILTYTVEDVVPNSQEEAATFCEQIIERYKQQLFKNDFSEIEVRVIHFLTEKNLDVDKKSDDYRKLCRELLKAEIEVKKIELERIKGNYRL